MTKLLDSCVLVFQRGGGRLFDQLLQLEEVVRKEEDPTEMACHNAQKCCATLCVKLCPMPVVDEQSTCICLKLAKWLEHLRAVLLPEFPPKQRLDSRFSCGCDFLPR